jgi:hypothetical protein
VGWLDAVTSRLAEPGFRRRLHRRVGLSKFHVSARLRSRLAGSSF